MAITYTVAECEAKILAYDAKIEEAACLPDGGTIGGDEIDGVDGMWGRLKEMRQVWVSRLLLARKGCTAPRRRVV